MAIGEAGSITQSFSTVTVSITFEQPIDNPVIVLTGTNNGGHEHSFRILSSDSNGFTFMLEEWESLDGAHPATETVNWVAIAEGTHTLPDGRTIVAGSADASHDTGAVAFDSAFAAPPVVVTTVASDNDSTTVDSDPFNITASGFDLRLQEEEGQDGVHVAETVNFIAISAGSDAGSGSAVTVDGVDEAADTVDLLQSFTDAIVVADTQTMNDDDPGNVVLGDTGADNVEVYFEEERSGDQEEDHAEETVGLFAFEAGVILCFAAGVRIATPWGERPVEDLAPGDLVLTRDNGPMPVRWTCQQTLSAARLARDPHLRPIRLRKDAIAPGWPRRDTLVSPQHRVLVSGWRVELAFAMREVLAPAKALINACKVRQVDVTTATYVHVLLDGHQILTANGAPMESFHPGEMAKSALDQRARAELFEILPELRWDTANFGQAARPALKVREARLLA